MTRTAAVIVKVEGATYQRQLALGLTLGQFLPSVVLALSKSKRKLMALQELPSFAV
jgi:hypothetical protein